MSQKQKQILRLFPKKELTISKKDIVKNCGFSYYCHSEKYIGEILSRMVKRGLLERVRPGLFKLGPGPKSRAKVESDDPKQLKLFKG